MFFINIPRSNDEHKIDYLYNVIELLKDGKFMSMKYQPRPVRLIECPHVIIFSNQEPDLTKLSNDRWEVVFLNEGNVRVI